MPVPKGPGCQGCPALAWGPWMVPDEDNPEAEVIVVAQNPGRDEEAGRRLVEYTGAGEYWETCRPGPLIGQSGWDLTKNYLPVAGLRRSQVECRNVVRCRQGGSNELPPLGQSAVRDIVRHCQRAYWRPVRPEQRLVVLGGYALWALTGEFGGEDESDEEEIRANRGIDGWRGWVVPYRPQHGVVGSPGPLEVFATWHPAYFYRAHWLKPVGKMDWHRVGKWLRGTWPEPMPVIERSVPREWPARVAFDTEYNPHTGVLHRYSVAWRDAERVPRVYVVEAQDLCLAGTAPHWVVQHNAEADWPYLASVFGGTWDPGRLQSWDDTMYAHAVLYGTWRHTLDFLGSLYARTNRWKQLQESNEVVYAGMDALGTWDVWERLERELELDPLTKAIYHEERKPLLKHIMQRPSIAVATNRVAAAVERFGAQQQEIQTRAQVAAGWPLKVTSPDQVARWLGIKTK